MNTNFIKLVGCMLWAGAAITSASRAEAVAHTTGVGTYATCTFSYTAQHNERCGYVLNYSMVMRFLSTACSSTGTCSSDYGGAQTEWVYTAGRKMTTLLQLCDPYRIYGIDPCAC
jgi:hypothetical protein